MSRAAAGTGVGPAAGNARTIETMPPSALVARARALLADGFRLGLIAAHDEGSRLRIVYLFLAGAPDRRVELHVAIPARAPSVPSLGSLSFPASRFERAMHDLFGVVPTDHPLPHRLIRHAHWPSRWFPMRRDAGPTPPFTHYEPFPFVEVEGDGVYEVPVGPVHAGLIEPAHFRFSVVGESVIKLKARLWFTHRGVEKLFEGMNALEATPLAERISGDTSAAHALAHVLAVEDALGLKVPGSARQLRAMLVEMERLYNHAADIGALAMDVGFSLANSHAQRIREELLRINDACTGSRLLRGAIYPGGVRLLAAPDPARIRLLAADLAEVAALTLANTVIRDRFAGTAVLSERQVLDLGCLGVVARASGLDVDARVDHPFADLPVSSGLAGSADLSGSAHFGAPGVSRREGDVLARFAVRVDEFAASSEMVCDLAAGAERLEFPAARPGRGAPPSPIRSGVGIVEGWRGTIVHRVEVDPEGRFTRAAIVDPSWFNWPALPLAMEDTILPDFPVTNKSFNLSYAGNDL
jgi:Ni,Fe-hydrogenase III large subunit/Ni,Fe-hydrogenase III component G